MSEEDHTELRIPAKPQDEGWRFMRLARAAARLMPSRKIPKDADDVSPAVMDELLETPDAFVEPNPDESETPNSETVIHQYGASVSWLSFDNIKVAVDLLKHQEGFEGQTFRVVNRNWPYRNTHDLIHWLGNAFQPPKVNGSLLHPKALLAPLEFQNFPAVRDTSTSRIPYYNPMLPTIDPDGPPHIALLVMGGNDMLEDLDAVKDGSMTAKEFGEGMFKRTKVIIEAMREAGFQRVAVVPLNRNHVPDIIRSLDIPEEMVDELGVAYHRIAEEFPEFVYMSPHDLYEGLNPETDYLDSPIKQEHLKVQRWESPVYKATSENDAKHGRERLHPNPLGQVKVAKTMAQTVSEAVRGLKSPCLDDPTVWNKKDAPVQGEAPATQVGDASESGVIQDMQREIAR